MKLKIEFTKNTKPVPFTYMSNVNGYLHTIIGRNNKYHDKLSHYSTSFLHGGKITKDKKHLDFSNGVVWYISSPDVNFLMNNIAVNIDNHPDFIYGMKLNSINRINVMDFDEQKEHIIKTKSPILLKWYDNKTKKNFYYTYESDDSITSQMMKNIIIKKAKLMGKNLNSNDFDIKFNREYEGKKIKWSSIKNIHHKTSVCPVKVKANDKDILNLIYDLGVGHSTGSGFGFLL
jgi:CRISPR-associated endoribonuclease Cas6